MERRPVVLRVAVALLIALAAAAVAGGSSSPDPPSPAARSRAALYGGTVISDASQLGVVYLEYVPTQSPAEVGCDGGTGVLLTNDIILTAAHVADYQTVVKKPGCVATPPAFLRVSMPDPAAVDGVQRRWISCGGTVGCGEWLHPHYVPNPGVVDTVLRSNNGEDAALIRVGSFIVKGVSSFYERPLTSKPTSDFHGKSVTCYGMGEASPKLPNINDPTGILRKADFTVLPFPHPNSIAEYKAVDPTIPLLPSKSMFAVSRGGGVTPTVTAEAPDGAAYTIPVPGDSGGPCIDHTNSTDGEIVGIDHAGSGEKSGGAPTPAWVHYSASSGFREWVNCRLKGRVRPVPLDCDGDGQVDDSVRVRKSSSSTLEIVVAFNGGAQEVAFDTLLSEGAADVGCALAGDFNSDGASDVIATAGAAASAIPYLFSGGFPFTFTNLSTWKPSGPYAYYSVGRFNQDSVDDVTAVRFDGTEDVFLGEPGKGLTTPAHLFPRGFRFFAADDAESYAISAPSFSKKLSFSTPGSIKATPGTIYLLSKDAQGTQYHDALDLSGGGAVGMPTSAPADAYGFAMAWGNFSKNAQGLADLVTGAPGRAVGSAKNAGVVQWLHKGVTNTEISAIDRSDFGENPAQSDYFGRTLSAGDFNGDGADDLAIGRAGGVHVMTGGGTSGFPLTAKHNLTGSTFGVSGSGFGSSLTSGDFNCDGFEDLAIGMDGIDFQGTVQAGAVFVTYGGPSGLSVPTAGQGGAWQRVDKSMGLGGAALKAYDHFGYQLVAGNFNGDTYIGRPCIDLAVASEPNGGLTFGKGGKLMRVLNMGAVTIVRGGPSGMTAAGAQHLKQGSMAGGTAIKDIAEIRDQFGQGLAITAADTDGFDDLVIGAWGEDDAAGAAHVLRGSAQGITGTGQALWRQSDLSEPAEAGDAFGQTVGGTSNGVVILSAPGETYPGPELGKPDIREAGWVALIRLSDSSPVTAASVVPVNEAKFGALTAGRLFGRAVTAARPAFVPVSRAQVRFSGTMIF